MECLAQIVVNVPDWHVADVVAFKVNHVVTVLVEAGDQEGQERFADVLSIFPNSEPSVNRADRCEQLEILRQRDEDAMWAHFTKHDDEFLDNPFPTDEALLRVIKARADEICPVWID